MRSHVSTTNGPIAFDELGATLMHEHVLIGFPGWYFDIRQPAFKRDEAMARAVDAFQRLHDYGVKTVVDPCPMDLGRNVEFNAEVSQRSGIQIICATGVYSEQLGMSCAFRHLELEEITEIYVREIEDGIGRTGIKAGLVKIATGEGVMSDYERKMTMAAARAAKATGVPILSHTENCSCGHDQIDTVMGEGVPAAQLLVGHSDGRDDHPYQRGLAERGAYVGFDRFGLEIYVPDSIRMKNVAQLVEAGHQDRIILSHDSTDCFLGGRIPGFGDADDFRRMVPNWRMTHLFETILPELRRNGLSAETLHTVMTANPRRFFAAAAQ